MKKKLTKKACLDLLKLLLVVFLLLDFSDLLAQKLIVSKDVKDWYVGWHNNPDSLGILISDTFTAGEKDSLRTAMQRWNAAGCTPKFKEVSSSADAQVTITKKALDDGVAGECTTYRSPGDNKVVKAEINISPDHNSPPNPLSLKEVVTHELGHALGLKDTDAAANTSDVMKGSGPSNGSDGNLSAHDSTEMRLAANNITVIGEEPEEKIYAFMPEKAIIPGEFDVLGFELMEPYPPGTSAIVQPFEDDLLFVEFTNIFENILEVGVFTFPEHYSGELYLDITISTPEGLIFNYLGIHYININPVPLTDFDCPFLLTEEEGKYFIDWIGTHTYPFPNPLRATLVVDEEVFYEVRPNGNFKIDLMPGGHLIELFVDDYQVNSAQFNEFIYVPSMITIADVQPPDPYPGENVRVYGEFFGAFTPESAIEINGMIYHEEITYWSDNEVFFDMPYCPPGDIALRIVKNPLDISDPVILTMIYPAEACFILPNEHAIVSENIVHLYAAADIYQELIQSASFYFRPVDSSEWEFIGTDLDGSNQHYSTTGPVGSGDGWAVDWDASAIDEMEIELKVEMTDIYGNLLTGLRNVFIDKKPLIPFIDFDASKLYGGKAIDGDSIVFDIKFEEEKTVKVEFKWAPPPIPEPGGWEYERELEPVGQYSITFVDKSGNDIRDASCGPAAMASCLKWLSQKYPDSQIAGKTNEDLAKELAKDADTDTTGTRDDNLESAAKDQLKNDPVMNDKFDVQRHENHKPSKDKPAHNVYNDIAQGLRDSSDVVMMIMQVNGNGETVGHYVTASSHHETISYVSTEEYCAAVQTSYVDFMDPSTGQTEYKVINWYDNPPQIQDYDLDTTTNGNAWVQSVITIKPKKEEKTAPKELLIAQFAVPGPGTYQFSIASTAFATGVNIVELYGVDSEGNEAGTYVTCVVGAYQPIANFTADKQSVAVGVPVQFTDISNPKDSITNWHWNFGDGTNSDESHPQHVFYNEGIYPIELIVSDGTLYDTLVRENYITVTPPPTQLLLIAEGWGGLSSHVDPENNDIETVFAPIVDDLIVLYNMSGVYWPETGTNTLYDWDTFSGYAVKVTTDVNLSLTGVDLANESITLAQGWNLIPVFSQTSSASVLGGLPGFVVAKGVANAEIMWPEYNINTMPTMKLGSAYYVYTTQAGSISFAKGGDEDLQETRKQITLTPWNAILPSPNTHLVAFTTESLKSLQSGDMIAAFTQTGRCAGAVLIADVERQEALILNGDDPTINERSGFAECDPILLKVYRENTGEIFDLEVSYNPKMNTGHFETHGLSEVNMARLSAASVEETNISSMFVFPNPSGCKFNIDGISGDADISIFNAYGIEVFTGHITLPAEVDLSAQPRGIYLLRIELQGRVHVEKLFRN